MIGKLAVGVTERMFGPARRRRVLQITHDLGLGGLQRVVVDLAKHLNPERYEVAVCAIRGGGLLEDELRLAGVRVVRPVLANGGRDYLTWLKLARLLRRERPDVVHTHNTQPFLEGGIARLLAQVPVHVHTDHGRAFPDKRRYQIAERVMSVFADRVVAVSDAVKTSLVRYERMRPSRVTVVHNGIDGSAFDSLGAAESQTAVRQSLGLRQDAGPVLGFCGRLEGQKGLEYLLRALPVLVQSFPGLVLLIAGDGSVRNSLEREAVALGVADRVRFLGARTDVPRLLRAMDLFVLPSLWEGLPLVLLEAMAAGLPIVATDVGGNGIAVRHGHNGLLVPPADSTALARAIHTLASGTEMRARFAERARALFEAEFTVTAMVSRYERLYDEIATRRFGTTTR